MSEREHPTVVCGLRWTGPHWNEAREGDVYDHQCFRAAGHGSKRRCMCMCGSMLGVRPGVQDRPMTHLQPAEHMALTVARAQAGRGDAVPPNTAAMLVLTIDRLVVEAEELAIARIVAENPGIDPDKVRASRAKDQAGG